MATISALPQPGQIILFGSGETSPTGRKVFEPIFHTLPASPNIALLETPAGFELNSHQVIGRVGDFFTHRLQNFHPQVSIIPARKRGTPFSPDEPSIVEPLLKADLIFMGPGSPSYAIRQLRESLAWYYLFARHRLGAVLALASAATVAFSACALPVYEIYKVGEELHWIDGLDFFNLYGLSLVFIPHWNNQEGGAELDTSRCFMGKERFLRLMEMLPGGMTIVGLDEKTALIMEPSHSACHVRGLGTVTLIHTGHQHIASAEFQASNAHSANLLKIDEELAVIAEQRYGHIHQFHQGESFPMSEIGQFHPYLPETSLPLDIWQKAIHIASHVPDVMPDRPPELVLRLIQERENARCAGSWEVADSLRQKVTALGWEITDTKDGPLSKKLLKN